MSEDTFVEIFRAKNNPQAIVLQQALEDAGIPVMVENALLQGVVGELPLGWVTAPRLLVRDQDAARARDLVVRWEAAASPLADPADEKPDDGLVCLSCGAPMAEDAETCGQCGWTFEADEAG